jgi:hypothetical protein
MSFLSGLGHFFGVSSPGSTMNAADSATEDTIQAALDKLVTGPKAFGNRTISATDAEKQLTAAGVLPPGWRLRESDSTSSGYRPTQAATKTMGAIHAAQIGAAAFTGGASLAGSGIGLGANAALQGGLGAASGGASGGVKGALLGGALGAASGGFAPGVGGGATGLLKNAAVQGGLGALGGVAGGGGLKAGLLGGATGAAGAYAGRLAPSLTQNPLGQQAINAGVNAGLSSARSGSFNPLSVGLGAAGNFLPSAAGLTSNPLLQRAINYGGQQAIDFGKTRQVNPMSAALGAAKVVAPTNIYSNYLGG